MNKKYIIGLFLLINSCASESDAITTAKNAGINVGTVQAHYIGSSFFGCRKDDDAAFQMSGTNAHGALVNVVVCCSHGLFGSCTVRYQR